MLINRNQYVVINVWTSKTNKALAGANVGHVSLSTSGGRYISLWPAAREHSSTKSNQFFQATERKLQNLTRGRIPEYQDSYARDCLNEAQCESGHYTLSLTPENKDSIQKHTLYIELTSDNSLQYTVIAPSRRRVTGRITATKLEEIQSGILTDLTSPLTNIDLSRFRPILPHILKITAERGHTKEVLFRSIRHRNELDRDETVYRFDSTIGEYELWEEAIPAFEEDKYSFWAVKLLPAQFRMVLYSLDIKEIEYAFERLNHGVSGWTLMGSNRLSQYFSANNTTENCASLASRCLRSGGLFEKLESKASSQTSSIVSPDDLVRLVVAAKERELNEYPETKDWIVANTTETSLEEVKRRYAQVGQNANVEEDFLSIIPSIPNKTCSVM